MVNLSATFHCVTKTGFVLRNNGILYTMAQTNDMTARIQYKIFMSIKSCIFLVLMRRNVRQSIFQMKNTPTGNHMGKMNNRALYSLTAELIMACSFYNLQGYF